MLIPPRKLLILTLHLHPAMHHALPPLQQKPRLVMYQLPVRCAARINLELPRMGRDIVLRQVPVVRRHRLPADERVPVVIHAPQIPAGEPVAHAPRVRPRADLVVGEQVARVRQHPLLRPALAELRLRRAGRRLQQHGRVREVRLAEEVEGLAVLDAAPAGREGDDGDDELPGLDGRGFGLADVAAGAGLAGLGAGAGDGEELVVPDVDDAVVWPGQHKKGLAVVPSVDIFLGSFLSLPNQLHVAT
jgi:hypothetical protein